MMKDIYMSLMSCEETTSPHESPITRGVVGASSMQSNMLNSTTQQNFTEVIYTSFKIFLIKITVYC